MATPKLTDEIIDAAILGFEVQKRRINAQIAELQGMRSGHNAATVSPTQSRRRMSAAGRKAIAEAQRKRWAAVRKDGAAPQSTPKKAKRKLSAAGRAAIVAALKKRWAAKKAAKKG